MSSGDRGPRAPSSSPERSQLQADAKVGGRHGCVRSSTGPECQRRYYPRTLRQTREHALAEMQDSEADWGYIHVLGGDTFVKTTDEDAGERGGGYANDVWVSDGVGWELYYEGSKPMAESTMLWDEVNPGRTPPAGVTYEDWIICQARRRDAPRDMDDRKTVGVESLRQLQPSLGREPMPRHPPRWLLESTPLPP